MRENKPHTNDVGARESTGSPDPASIARTHLANERTFLAWLRTGITLIALGLAAAQFLVQDIVPGVPLTRTVATGLVISGIFVTLAGLRRYFANSERIEAGEFRVARISIAVAAALLLVVGLTSIVFVLLIGR